MYPLNYVFCPPKHRISGVSDYLAIRRNSPDPLSCEALGSRDRLHRPRASMQPVLWTPLSAAGTIVAPHNVLTNVISVFIH